MYGIKITKWEPDLATLIELGIRTAMNTGFDIAFLGKFFFEGRFPDGGPVELIGSMGIDPRTGEHVFLTTEIRFHVDRIIDVPVHDIGEVYLLASKGNRKALDAIEALRQRNASAFRDSFRGAHEVVWDDENRVQYRYLS